MKKAVFYLMLATMMQFPACQNPGIKDSSDLLDMENLIAWCIVPFDAAKRSPEDRATMLKELGISQLAYDYRDEHIPSFRKEIEVLKENQIKLSAVWLWIEPELEEVLNFSNKSILKTLEETETETELWVSLPAHIVEDIPEEERLERVVDILREVLDWAKKNGCTIALYNHGDWFGEPENQIRIIEAMGSDKIKIVYNFHHGHHQIERFEELLQKMLPYLSAININGMKVEGPKIITLGEGDHELEMMRMIINSGFKGSIGILGHTEGEDIKPVLQRNLKGLQKLKNEL